MLGSWAGRDASEGDLSRFKGLARQARTRTTTTAEAPAAHREPPHRPDDVLLKVCGGERPVTSARVDVAAQRLPLLRPLSCWVLPRPPEGSGLGCSIAGPLDDVEEECRQGGPQGPDENLHHELSHNGAFHVVAGMNAGPASVLRCRCEGWADEK